MSWPRSNSNEEVHTADSMGGMGVSFQFRHPKDARACYRPQSGQSSVDRHKECPSLWRHCSWGCFIICRIMVPFHNLWTDGGETEKRPPCPPSRVIESAQDSRSHFRDTTLAPKLVDHLCRFSPCKALLLGSPSVDTDRLAWDKTRDEITVTFCLGAKR